MTNTQIPSYSGVTINISNPTVNANPYTNGTQIYSAQPTQTVAVTSPIEQKSLPQMDLKQPQSYPPEYYINNYNTLNQNKENNSKLDSHEIMPTTQDEIVPTETTQTSNAQANTSQADSIQTSAKNSGDIAIKQEDMTLSNNIINQLDAETAKQKELEENGTQTRVVTLTDEYIKSLENYLNNQNTEIRLMAAKEILTRLDEDKSRYDDAALNALLNKMLQDPQKLVRIAALSAFSSGLASGNDYTVQLLNNIQQNPNSDKQDVVEAANILLKMSADTEVRYTQNQQNNQNNIPKEEQKATE